MIHHFHRLRLALSKHPLRAGFFFAVIANALWLAARPLPVPSQPIAFNHALHIKNGMDCVDCHAGAKQQASAMLPAADTCATCHQTAITKSPEEARLVSLIAQNQPLAWNQVTRVAPHVYFSHRRHAEIGKIQCAECHGAMDKLTSPPQQAFRAMNMKTCLTCHDTRDVKSDCNDCHH